MFKFLAALACVLTITQALYPYAEQDNIINIGDPTWQTAINEFPAGLIVHFYEPYCFPCRQFWPELHKSAQDLLSSKSAAKIGKIECHDEIKLCNARGVSAFPTILLHKGEAHYEYRGPRVAEAFTAWVHKAVDYKYPTADSEEDLFDRSSVVILVKDTNVNNVNEAILGLLDIAEVFVAGSSLKSKLGSNSAVILTQGGQSVTVAPQENGESIRNKVKDLFAQGKAVPNFSWEMSSQLKDDKNYDFAVFFRTKSFKSGSDAAQQFDKAAQEFSKANSIIFAYVNVVDDMVGDTVAQLFGVAEDDQPTVGLISKKGKPLQKYKLDGDVTFSSIQKLIQDWQAGSGTRYYMSAEVPDGQTGYVRELVTKNYNDVTNDPKSNVLVMLYFPWCEPCVKLEPTWKALAYRSRSDKNVVVARIDISQNDVQGYDISDYPVILFYPEGDSKKAVQYTGQTNINGIKNFLFDQVSSLKDQLEL